MVKTMGKAFSKKLILGGVILLMLLFTACTTKTATSAPESNVVVSKAGRVIYKAVSFNEKKQGLKGVYIVVRNDDMSLRAVLCSDYADWQGSKWEIMNPTQYTPDEYSLGITPVDPKILAEFDEPPETFRPMAAVATPAVLFESNSVTRTKDFTIVVGDVGTESVSDLVFFDVDKNRKQRITVSGESTVNIPGNNSVPMQLNMSSVTILSFNPQKKDDYEVITTEEVIMDLK